MKYKTWGLIFALWFAPSALAQQASIPPIPENPARDENGVDVAGWNNVSFSWSPISLGISGQNGFLLEYYDLWSGRNNFTADLTVPDANAALTIATFGNSTTTFNDGVHSSTEPGTSSVCSASLCNYILRDGTEVDYFVPSNFYSLPSNGSYTLYPSQVKFSSGEVWTYHNKTFYPPYPYTYLYVVRPQSIVSNRGYQVKFDYLSNTIGGSYLTWSPWWTLIRTTIINNAYDYCDPDADACSLSMSWPNVSISPGVTTTITNDQGYQYKLVSSSLGSGSFKYQVFTPRSTSETASYITELYQHPDDINNPYVPPGNLRTRIKSFTRGGSTWNYNYTFNTPYGTVTRVAPDGTSRKFHVVLGTTTFITTPPKVDWLQDELGNTSNYTYDYLTRILTAQKPEGNSQQIVYDDRSNVTQSTTHAKPGSGLADVTVAAVYPASIYPSICTYKVSCNKPSAVVGANGGQTDFTYDNVHGGTLSEMGPAPTPGAARPLRLTSWTQRYAWVKSAGGSLVQAPSPVWIKATETQCQGAAGSNSPVCDGAAQQTVTTYEYGAAGGPDALLIKGLAVSSGGVTLRTCYSYDRYARKVSETKPNANLGACP